MPRIFVSKLTAVPRCPSWQWHLEWRSTAAELATSVRASARCSGDCCERRLKIIAALSPRQKAAGSRSDMRTCMLWMSLHCFMSFCGGLSLSGVVAEVQDQRTKPGSSSWRRRQAAAMQTLATTGMQILSKRMLTCPKGDAISTWLIAKSQPRRQWLFGCIVICNR